MARHRKTTRFIFRRRSACAAAVAGAVLTAGFQLGMPALAQAGPVSSAVQAVSDAVGSVSTASLGGSGSIGGAGAVSPASGAVTSGFGPRWGATHGGVDIAADLGAPVLAAADGTVAEAGPATGFGLWVRVAHDDGTTTVYGHINEALVQEGQRVRAGEQIATVGNRGNSTGPHLHFEVWDPAGGRIDPELWLLQRGAALGVGGLGLGSLGLGSLGVGSFGSLS